MSEKKEISQKIVNYAIWYYLKYFPSIAKMRQKLDMKFGPKSEKGIKYGGIFEDDIDYILQEKMGNILVEKEIISSKIRGYLMRGKNYYYIVQKLNEKLFIKEEFEEILRTEFNSDNTTLLDREKLYKQVFNLKNKNKSKNYIRNKFVDRRLDEEIVDEVISEIYIHGEEEILYQEFLKVIKAPIFGSDMEQEKYCQKYIQKLGFKEKQKLTTKMVAKGFEFGDILCIIKKYEN